MTNRETFGIHRLEVDAFNLFPFPFTPGNERVETVGCLASFWVIPRGFKKTPGYLTQAIPIACELGTATSSQVTKLDPVVQNIQ